MNNSTFCYTCYKTRIFCIAFRDKEISVQCTMRYWFGWPHVKGRVSLNTSSFTGRQHIHSQGIWLTAQVGMSELPHGWILKVKTFLTGFCSILNMLKSGKRYSRLCMPACILTWWDETNPSFHLTMCLGFHLSTPSFLCAWPWFSFCFSSR